MARRQACLWSIKYRPSRTSVGRSAKTAKSDTADTPGPIHAPIWRGRSRSPRSARYGQPGTNSRNAERARRNPAARRFHLCRTGSPRISNDRSSRENESGTSVKIASHFVIRRTNSGRLRSIPQIRNEGVGKLESADPGKPSVSQMRLHRENTRQNST